MTAWNITDQFQVFFLNCIGRVSHWDLIEYPPIDRASLRHRLSVLVRNERLPEEFAHFAVDLTRPEIAIIQENLQSSGGLLVIIRQRDRIHPRRRSSFVLRDGEDSSQSRCENHKREFHRRKLSAVSRTRECDLMRFTRGLHG